MGDNQFHKKNNQQYTMQDLLKGKDLEIIAASLLLLGKLKVESVELFRNSPIIGVSLVGKYRSKDDDKANKIADFLEQNGDMTLDDVFDALSKRMSKKRK